MNIGFLAFMGVLLSEDGAMRIPCIPLPAVEAVGPIQYLRIVPVVKKNVLTPPGIITYTCWKRKFKEKLLRRAIESVVSSQLPVVSERRSAFSNQLSANS
jgi:hypothetical protein